jgi:hypothetical protein
MRSFTWPSWSFRTVRSVRIGDPDETWLPGGYGRLGGPGRPPEESRPGPPRRGERRADAGAAGNGRLTAANAAVLLVLLAAEGVTILRVHQLLSPHVFIGVVLIPPVLLKVASTTWRFARYYTGAPAYRRKGAPPVLLRLLGPVVVILTLVLLFSGVGLLLVSRPWLALLLKVHKASFVLWFGAMTIHVLGHLGEVFRLAPRDWLRRTRREVTGAGARQWLIAASLVAGVMLGFLLLSHVGHWLSVAPGAGQ